MKLPEASENIYPKTVENLGALLEKYFRQTSTKNKKESIDQWMEDNFFTLNQIEFGARFAVQNKDLVDKAEFSVIPAPRVKNALMSIFFPKSEWGNNGANNKRREKFRDLFKDSFFKNWPE